MTAAERMAYAGWLPLRREPREEHASDDYPAIDRGPVDTHEDAAEWEAFYAAREVRS